MGFGEVVRELMRQCPPGTLLMLGALIAPWLKGWTRKLFLLALPLLSLGHLLGLPLGTQDTLHVLGLNLEWLRVDRLSRVFGIVFHLAAFLGLLYALELKDRMQQCAALLYAGSATAALFAADLLSLFLFWEATAFTSVFLIWARGTETARRAGQRYLIIQVLSGVLLLAGSLAYSAQSGSLSFGKMDLDSAAGLLIFLAFGIKAAFPLLHPWLQDAYPKATVTGTVFLSAFTTKLAIYALARAFPGEGVLIPIGALMTLFPIVFAAIENDLRKVLAYSLNNQLGFMVVGVGVGTEMALNGTAAHAFAHILYKSLLFMSMGAILQQAGTVKASELGGLYRRMPWTTAFCIVGAVSISALPLTSGFVSKSLILSAVAEEHHLWVFLALLFASAGVMEHSGIKIPFEGFFGHHERQWPAHVREVRWPKRWAMGLTAAACLLIGIFPRWLYDLLPYDVQYQPYTGTHVVTQFQLLFFATLAFVVLWRAGLYPHAERKINLDADWTYRRLLPSVVALLARLQLRLTAGLGKLWAWVRSGGQNWLDDHFGPRGLLGEPWTTGRLTMWAAILLAVSLILYYL